MVSGATFEEIMTKNIRELLTDLRLQIQEAESLLESVHFKNTQICQWKNQDKNPGLFTLDGSQCNRKRPGDETETYDVLGTAQTRLILTKYNKLEIISLILQRRKLMFKDITKPSKVTQKVKGQSLHSVPPLCCFLLSGHFAQTFHLLFHLPLSILQ